jgi:hypothetical protein
MENKEPSDKQAGAAGQEGTKPAAEAKAQAKAGLDRLLELGNRKYRIDFEVNGWVIAAIALVILLLIAI